MANGNSGFGFGIDVLIGLLLTLLSTGVCDDVNCEVRLLLVCSCAT